MDIPKWYSRQITKTTAKVAVQESVFLGGSRSPAGTLPRGFEMKLSGYDYIVVGAGSAGCVLASRLSEDPEVNVLLLEAGSSAASVFVHMPAGIRVLYTSPKYNWQFWTEPQTRLNNRKIYIPRGGVVGGSSSINSMIAIRGNAWDYDSWAAQGLPAWSYENLRPYLRKIEDATLVTGTHDQDRGYSGPIRLSHGTQQHQFKSLLKARCQPACRRTTALMVRPRSVLAFTNSPSRKESDPVLSAISTWRRGGAISPSWPTAEFAVSPWKERVPAVS